MRKSLLLVSLLTSSASAFAASSYTEFQKFDNQFNLGYGITSGKVSNAGGQKTAGTDTQFISLEIERLFDVGVWLRANASYVSYYGQSQVDLPGGKGNTTGSQPNFGGININVGYAFPLIANHLLLTPYGLVGKNTNISTYTVAAAGSLTNITQDSFYSFGLGGRLEYRINNYVDVYLDQNAVYNDSHAPVQSGFTGSGNYSFTTALGAKFNVVKYLQLGVQGFFTAYSFPSLTNTSTGPLAPVAGVIPSNFMVPTTTFGGLVTLGLTY